MTKLGIQFELGGVTTGAGIVVQKNKRNGLEKSPKPVGGYADLTKMNKNDVIVPEELNAMNHKDKDHYLMRKDLELTVNISKQDSVRKKCKKQEKALHEWLMENVPKYRDMINFQNMRRLSLKNENRLRDIREEIRGDAKKQGIILSENRQLQNFNGL